MMSCKVLISIGLLACCLAQLAASTIEGSGSFFTGGEFYALQYKNINNYLMKTALSEDVELNLQAAEQYLDVEFSEHVSLPQRPLVEALKQFLALKQVANKCDMEAYATLYKNYKASAAFGSGNRIYKVIEQVAVAHAKHCQDFYEEEFDSKRGTFNIKAIEAFSDRVVYNLVTRFHVREIHADSREMWFGEGVMDYIVNKKVKILKEEGPKYAFDALETLTENTEDEQYLARKVNDDGSIEALNTAKLTELYNTHIVEPCKKYINQVSDLFERAKFDAMWHREFRNCEKTFYERFYYGWGSFEVCKRLINHDQNSVLKGLIELVSHKRRN